MLTVTRTNDPINIRATVNGLTIYLDNHSFVQLAGRDEARRRRFIEMMKADCDLLFSVSNAAEISRSEGDSAKRILALLDEIGAHWFPVELESHSRPGAPPCRPSSARNNTDKTLSLYRRTPAAGPARTPGTAAAENHIRELRIPGTPGTLPPRNPGPAGPAAADRPGTSRGSRRSFDRAATARDRAEYIGLKRANRQPPQARHPWRLTMHPEHRCRGNDSKALKGKSNSEFRQDRDNHSVFIATFAEQTAQTLTSAPIESKGR